VADRCECGLPLDPPEDQDYWWPTIDEPDRDVHTVTRYGEHPTYRRVIREELGWRERGCSVDGTGTPGLIQWERVGRCWVGQSHPVVAVKEGYPPRRHHEPVTARTAMPISECSAPRVEGPPAMRVYRRTVRGGFSYRVGLVSLVLLLAVGLPGALDSDAGAGFLLFLVLIAAPVAVFLAVRRVDHRLHAELDRKCLWCREAAKQSYRRELRDQQRKVRGVSWEDACAVHQAREARKAA
jgi:hypothetical protein